MVLRSRREYLEAIRLRYHRSSKKDKAVILDEFCSICGYVPNYRLRQCYEATPELQSVKPLTLRKSLSSLRLNLYDEQQRRLVSFRSMKRS